MSPLNTGQSNVLHLDANRRKIDDPILEQLINGIVSSVRERERKNKELEERNVHLQSALKQANEKIARLEQSTSTNPGSAEVVLRLMAQMLGRTEETLLSLQTAANALQKAARAKHADGCAEADALASKSGQGEEPLLDEDREEVDRPSLETAQKAVDNLTGVVEPRLLSRSGELVVSPFRNLASLSAFYKALRQLPGVVEVKAEQFDRGTLRATIEYCGPTALAGQLMQLSEFELRLVSAEGDRIEAFILDQDSLRE